MLLGSYVFFYVNSHYLGKYSKIITCVKLILIFCINFMIFVVNFMDI